MAAVLFQGVTKDEGVRTIILDISFLYIFSQRKHFSITIFLTQILMSETYPKTFTFLLAQVSSKF